ncbi:MAG: hypothetical protein OEV42_13820 [Deltaproteobacteria bacterium]|nr:hypothetical protein [Deltaproteobacteria bacterium]
MKQKEFDIVLVYSFGRENLNFLSIIKYLSHKYKIALLLSDDKAFYDKPENQTFAKARITEKKIRDLCVEFGVKKVYVDEKCKCKLLLMYPVNWFSEDYLDKFRKNISWTKLIGLLFHARGFRNLDLLKDLGVDKYLAPAKFLIEVIAKSEGTYGELEGAHIIESGFPYKKYPLFDNLNLEIDYLIALPSISILRGDQCEKRYKFFKNLMQILRNIEQTDKVYLKHHNVRDKQRYYESFHGNVQLMKAGMNICSFIAKLSPIRKITDKLYSRSARFAHSIIENSYPSLEELTDYHNLGIELFLPYVKKGVFTGLSGTVFHTLYNKLPVHNCDPQKVTDDYAPFYRRFQIPCHNGELFFDEKNYELIPEEVRAADLIELIDKELALI